MSSMTWFVNLICLKSKLMTGNKGSLRAVLIFK